MANVFVGDVVAVAAGIYAVVAIAAITDAVAADIVMVAVQDLLTAAGAGAGDDVNVATVAIVVGNCWIDCSTCCFASTLLRGDVGGKWEMGVKVLKCFDTKTGWCR